MEAARTTATVFQNGFLNLNLPAHQVQKVVGFQILLKALLFSLAKQASRGEGLTTAVHFTRERRCTLKESFRFV